jgi:hypothetical protein
MPKAISYNDLRQSERLLLDLITNCIIHYVKRGRSVKFIYLSKNMWQVFIGMYRSAYTEKEWEERKDEKWYWDEGMATEIKQGSALQVEKITWELWPMKVIEA